MNTELGMKLNFRWRKQTGQYQNGEDLFLNRIHIASYSWNSARSQGEDTESIRYVGNVILPSLSDKAKQVYARNPEDIKPMIERIVENWFKEALREAN